MEGNKEILLRYYCHKLTGTFSPKEHPREPYVSCFSFLVSLFITVTTGSLSSQHHHQFQWDSEHRPGWGSKDIRKRKADFGPDSVAPRKLAAAETRDAVPL